MEFIAYGFSSILMIVIGFLIGSGKYDFLIAGYNVADEKEKESINIINIRKFMKKMLILLGCIQAFPIILNLLGINLVYTPYIITGLFIGITIISVIYMNVSEKFKK